MAEAFQSASAMTTNLRAQPKLRCRVRALDQVGQRLFPRFGREIMIRDEAGEFVQPITNESFERFTDFIMQGPALRPEQSVIGHFLGESVFEGILNLRQTRSFMEKIRILQTR